MVHILGLSGRLVPPLTLFLFILSMDIALAPNPAKATGKSAKITAYCDATYRPSGRGPAWKAKYFVDREQWWCIQEIWVGPQSRGGGRKVVEPAKACFWAHATSKVHTHRGLNYAIESNMHCGEHAGLMPSMANMQPARLKICNNTSAAKLAVGYAFLDKHNSATPNWTSIGYWGVDRGQCKSLKLQTRKDWSGYRGELYVFGYHTKALLTGSGRPMCVRTGPGFKQANADDKNACPAKGYTMTSTTRLNIRAGENRHDFSD